MLVSRTNRHGECHQISMFIQFYFISLFFILLKKKKKKTKKEEEKDKIQVDSMHCIILHWTITRGPASIRSLGSSVCASPVILKSILQMKWAV